MADVMSIFLVSHDATEPVITLSLLTSNKQPDQLQMSFLLTTVIVERLFQTELSKLK